jgi:coenzyme F420-dependent glucose-6-phosphate dehydrogenase
MTVIGYHASHEQFGPGDLLRWVQRAEDAGFSAAMCSDHFAPWSEQQGQSAFAWSWLGAAMQATSCSFGTVTAPGYRYHPAVIAQAAATLASMYPERFWVSLGTGEAMNERITGMPWPSKHERRARLRESVDIIRALWAGETVSHTGAVTVEEATLWTRPAVPPTVMGAALSPETAAWCASWADGLITVNAPAPDLEAILDAFRSNGGDGKPVYLQAHLAYAATPAGAEAAACTSWGPAILPAEVGQDIRFPRHFDLIGKYIRPEDVRKSVRISSDPGQHLEWIRQDLALGIDRIYLHQVCPNQDEFIDAFGRDVLPYV